MKDNKNSIIMYGVVLILLSLNAVITCYLINESNKQIEALQQSNNELIQQNTAIVDTLNEYEMNIKEYQSATDATINEMMEDVQEIMLEKEVNESDLHKEEQTKEEIKGEYVGVYELTAYEETGNNCADGVYPQVGYTAACNDSSLWHKWVYIEGVGERYIHDTGGMARNVIDIYMGDYSTCIQFGRRSAKVYLIER